MTLKIMYRILLHCYMKKCLFSLDKIGNCSHSRHWKFVFYNHLHLRGLLLVDRSNQWIYRLKKSWWSVGHYVALCTCRNNHWLRRSTYSVIITFSRQPGRVGVADKDCYSAHLYILIWHGQATFTVETRGLAV